MTVFSIPILLICINTKHAGPTLSLINDVPNLDVILRSDCHGTNLSASQFHEKLLTLSDTEHRLAISASTGHGFPRCENHELSKLHL